MQADYEAEGKDIWGGARILLLPTVIINTNQYRGRLDTPSILRALCAGFSESTEPEVRVRWSNLTCAAEGCSRDNGTSGVRAAHPNCRYAWLGPYRRTSALPAHTTAGTVTAGPA